MGEPAVGADLLVSGAWCANEDAKLWNEVCRPLHTGGVEKVKARLSLPALSEVFRMQLSVQ